MNLLERVKIMNKEEFLSKLRKKLNILAESEVDDIINEYQGYIEEKVSAGATEEEAVKELGNINEIADDLLSAYKVKTQKGSDDIIEKIVNKFEELVELFISKFEGKSAADILRFCIELALILLIVFICKLPFVIIEGIFKQIFYTFGDNNVLSFVNNIWHFVFELCYLVFAVVLFIKLFKRKFDSVEPGPSNENNQKKSNAVKPEKVVLEKKRKPEVSKKDNKSLADLIYTLCQGIVKFILIWILFSICCYIIGIVCASTFYVYLLIKGVHYFGIGLILLALLSGGIVFFETFFKLLTVRKNNWTRVLISLIVCLVFLGVGGTITAMDIANTTYVPYDNETNIKREIKNIPMEDNLTILGISEKDLIIDETVTDIRIEYSYNDIFTKMVPILDRDEFNVITLNYSIRNYNLKKAIDYEIGGLKEKKLLEIDESPRIRVFTNKENHDKLMANFNAHIVKEARQDRMNYEDDYIEE